MTKIEYIDYIRNSLQMVDKTSKFHRAQVETAINSATNTVFYELFQKNPKSFRKAMERYAVTVTADVTTTSALNRYGASLTVDVVDLPRATGGILEVDSKTTLVELSGLYTQFVPMTTMQGEQMYNSESALFRKSTTATPIGFSYSRTRQIEFWGMRAADVLLHGQVYVRLLKQFTSYANTDNVNMPYGQDERIMELVRQYLGVIPPKDLINNNRDNG